MIGPRSPCVERTAAVNKSLFEDFLRIARCTSRLGPNVDDEWMPIIVAGDKISFFLRNASFLRS
jgi:hypothetical protein